tara:strand:- start:663 stop:1832 length:1170 start_codon:yes stop_codon:yes gene_type:complete
MGKIKIKHREPKRTEFTPNDIVIDVKNGRLFYKSNHDIFRVTGVNITTVTPTNNNAIDPAVIDQINEAIAAGDADLAAQLEQNAIDIINLEAADSNLLDDAANTEVLFNNNGTIDGNSSFKFLPTSTTLQIGATTSIEGVFKLKNNSTPTTTFDNSAGAGTQNPGITLGGEEINESSTSPGSFSGGSLKLQTPFGNVKIGPRNTGFCHFYTDRSKYYFNKRIIVDEGIIASYNEDLKLIPTNDTARSHIVIKNTTTDCHVEVHGDIIAKPQGDNFGKLMAENDVIAFASDKRLKENIVEISNPLDKIQQVRGVYFDWNQKSKEEGFKAAREKNEIGMIAQEVEQIIPQAIEPAPFNKEYKTIKYDRLIPLLVECIKDQQKQIDELKNKL